MRRILNAAKKLYLLALYIVLGTTLSCKIEGEFSDSYPPEFLGEQILDQTNEIVKLFWYEPTNEIIVVCLDGIIAVSVDKKAVRRLRVDDIPVAPSTFLNNNTIYIVGSNRISIIDVRNFKIKSIVLDSIAQIPFSDTFFGSQFAYAKIINPDVEDQAIFIYDLNSRTEYYVTDGTPMTFSQDGKHLAFLYKHHYYWYDLDSKNISPINTALTENDLVKWTNRGRFSYRYDLGAATITNETTKEVIGEWPTTTYFPSPHLISNSGTKIIISKDVVGGKYVTDLVYPANMNDTHAYFIVDVLAKTEKEALITRGYINAPSLMAFSPDEENFAYSTSDHKIFITKPKN